ncbi:MAG: hypothetical protein C4334_13015 [Pyrinomonas sp.]|uniref:hypothetical protein n=1 Tax=Pyrinomonas sp. TaxID=2080306 RepID=UPI0033259E6A
MGREEAKVLDRNAADAASPAARGSVLGREKEGIALKLRPRAQVGRAAIEQARLVLLIMINIAQLWTLSATVEASLAARWQLLVPLVASSGICALITLSILLWWRPDRFAPDR